MPNYLSRMKPNGANGTEYKLKDEELREAFDVFKEDIKGTQTATGNPITLTDGSETYVQGLSVELEPKQDLHGYDYPWVGGAGKNKLPLTVEGIKAANTGGSWSGNVYTINGGTFTILTDSDGNVTGIKVNGTFNPNTLLTLGTTSLNGSYILNGCPNGGYMYTYRMDLRRSTGGDILYTDEGSGVNINNINESVYVVIRIQGQYEASNLVFLPMIRLSTETDPTFAPYSNICPISGYEGVEVEDVGFNRNDEVYESGLISVSTGADISGSGIRSENYIECVGGVDYFLFKETMSSVKPLYIFWYDENKSFISNGYKESAGVVTSPSNARFFRLRADAETTSVKICINISKPTGTPKNGDYLPYQFRTASVTFGQTVYGGSVDLTTGVLTIDRIGETFDGSNDETWNRYSQGSASAYAMIGKLSELCKGAVADIVIKANELKSISYNSTFGNYDAFISNGDGNPSSLFITGVRSITTVNDWRTFLASNPLQVCYELAEPFTIQLTPQELKLLQDTNNLTTNGTTITLDYIPNNSIGDAVKASEEYTDRAVGRVAPKATLIDTWMISEESDTISVDLTSYDCNFFLLEYLFNSKKGTTLILRPNGSFSASVVTYNNGNPYYIELTYNPTTKELAYASNVTSQFGILAIYTI